MDEPDRAATDPAVPGNDPPAGPPFPALGATVVDVDEEAVDEEAVVLPAPHAASRTVSDSPAAAAVIPPR